MFLSGILRTAVIAVPFAVAGGGAIAQQIVTVPPGLVIMVAPGMANLSGEPIRIVRVPDANVQGIDRLFADQQATMARMMADMNAMFSGSMSPFARAGSGMTVAAPVPGGVSVCQESVSISYSGGTGAPLVKVSRSGNGCGPESGTGAVPAVTTPSARPLGLPKVMEINDPAPMTPRPVRHPT